jgi:hypothetical protein
MGNIGTQFIEMFTSSKWLLGVPSSGWLGSPEQSSPAPSRSASATCSGTRNLVTICAAYLGILVLDVAHRQQGQLSQALHGHGRNFALIGGKRYPKFGYFDHHDRYRL